MIVGSVPFDEQDPLAMLTAHVSREPPAFREIAPDITVPAGLEELVLHGMAKVSTERITSANDYLAGLANILRRAGYDSGVARASSPLLTTGPQPLVSSPPTDGLTPMPFSHELGTAPTAVLPNVTSTTASAPPSPYAKSSSVPIPKHWLKIGVVIFAVAIVVAVALAFGRHHGDDAGAPLSSSAPLDRDTRLKAALHDLEAGATCAERKAAVAQLVDLDDERAIPALKKARYRMTGGLLGIGSSNSNSCLKADADAAIKALSDK
jgi:hypothetical protein